MGIITNKLKMREAKEQDQLHKARKRQTRDMNPCLCDSNILCPLTRPDAICARVLSPLLPRKPGLWGSGDGPGEWDKAA